jgi:hypothetical protein
MGNGEWGIGNREKKFTALGFGISLYQSPYFSNFNQLRQSLKQLETQFQVKIVSLPFNLY